MKLPKITPEETQRGSTALPKTRWDTVLTATPIILTVLATVLAGLSSRELTLSQYHRALAAQHQSKAGDQWNFFQAKRSRRTNHENTVDLLQARGEAGKADAGALQTNAVLLLERLRRAERDTSRLLELLESTKGNPGTTGLQQAATQLHQTVREQVKEAEAAQARTREVIARKELRPAWSHLIGDARPGVEIHPIADAQIQQAQQAVQTRLTEDQTASLFRQIPEEHLRMAIETAEANAHAVEGAYAPISQAIAQIERVVDEQIALARSVQPAFRELEAAAMDLPEDSSQPLEKVRAAMAAVARSATALKNAADLLYVNFKTAWHAYLARRYQHETDYNKQAAEIYEVQVRKSSALAERHRDRSKNFFFGMLAAQAGVTIATFSLALKHQSVLWGLASLAGLGAVIFGVYVHFYT